MTNDIKGLFVQDGTLHIAQGGKVWSVKAEEGKEPNQWQVKHFADIGTSEEFIEAFSGELLELVDASCIFDAERDAVKNAVTTVLLEGLMPAYEHLRKIRRSATTALPELNRRQLYEDFARVLWHAYRHLFPIAAKLLGFKIEFMFYEKDEDFEQKVPAFMSKSPPLIVNVPELLRQQRRNWQQELASFRNDFLEHRKNAASFADFYQPKSTESLFEQAWKTMALLLAVFIEAHFLPIFSIMEIPPNERDPKRLRRWRHFQCAPVDRGQFTLK